MRGKRALLLLTALSLVLTLLAGCGNTAQETGEKAMVIGDTTFNSENWEETVDPHRTYNGWACRPVCCGRPRPPMSPSPTATPSTASALTRSTSPAWPT